MSALNLPARARSAVFGHSRRLSRLPARLAEQSDHLAIEGRDVVRLAARHKGAVKRHFLIHPLSAGVANIGLERGPRGDAPPARRAGLDDHPGAVTDRRHRLAGVEEGFHKLDRLWLHPESVGIDDSARQQQRVVIVRPGFVEWRVYGELIPPFREDPTADLFVPGRYDVSFSASLVERPPRFDHLDLLEAVLNQDRDLQSS